MGVFISYKLEINIKPQTLGNLTPNLLLWGLKIAILLPLTRSLQLTAK